MKYKIMDKTGFRDIGSLTIKGGGVSETTDEIRFMKGWILESVEGYCSMNQWRLIVVDTLDS